MPLPVGVTSEQLTAWYDARDLNYLPGQTVPTIPDSAGHGHTASALTTNRQAVFSSWKGFPALLFTTDCYKALWNTPVVPPFTIWAVAELTFLPPGAGIVSGYNTANKHLIAITRRNQRLGWDWVIENAGVGDHGYGGDPATDVRYILRLDIGMVDRLRVNGQTVVEGDFGPVGSIGITIGARETDERHWPGWLWVAGLGDVTVGDQVEAELLAIFG